MQTTIRKWGNSLGVRIPNEYAKDIHLHENSKVEIKLSGNVIVIKPESSSISLSELLSQVNSKNIHSEIDVGKNVGKETW